MPESRGRTLEPGLPVRNDCALCVLGGFVVVFLEVRPRSGIIFPYTKNGRQRIGSSMSLVGPAFLALLGAFSLQAAPPDSALDPKPFQSFFRKYCADCHLEGTSKGGLDLATLPTDLHDAETLRRWVRIYDRVRSGEMPPPKKERADAGGQDAFLKTLGAGL